MAMNMLKILRCNTVDSPILKSFVAQKKLLEQFCHADIHSDRIVLPSGTLNYIEVWNKAYKPGTKEPSTLLLTHGYGSGLGFYFKNIDQLSSIYDRVIAIDWLGMGSSDRASNVKNPIMWSSGNMRRRSKCSSWCNPMTTVRAVDFFIDSLEEFRKEKNLTSFVLAGHSLGGYLSGRYALKYPTSLTGLVLISPVGVPKPPAENALLTKKLSLGVKMMQAAWKLNFTPQNIVRWSGRRGEKTVRNVIEKRFGVGKFTNEEYDLIADYLYHITSAPASGEYALNSILTPIMHKEMRNGKEITTGSVYAKEPLEELFQCDLGLRIPSVFVMYGDHDWLHYKDILSSMEGWGAKLDLHRDYSTVPNAGHHLYLDNPDYFHSQMLRYKNIVFPSLQ